MDDPLSPSLPAPDLPASPAPSIAGVLVVLSVPQGRALFRLSETCPRVAAGRPAELEHPAAARVPRHAAQVRLHGHGGAG